MNLLNIFKSPKKQSPPESSEGTTREVYLKNHGWKKLLSDGEYGSHEGLSGTYYEVQGFGKVHEKYCKRFRNNTYDGR